MTWEVLYIARSSVKDLAGERPLIKPPDSPDRIEMRVSQFKKLINVRDEPPKFDAIIQINDMLDGK
jgi:hypothetical protein